jgi:hypothetical protein
MIVVTIVVDTDDASAVVATMLKATKTLKVVELHVGAQSFIEDDEADEVASYGIAPQFGVGGRTRLVPMGDPE